MSRDGAVSHVDVAERFRLRSKIGHGSFGDIYSGTDLTTGGAVAVKLEHVRCARPQLQHEYEVYCTLDGSGDGVAHAIWFGTAGDYRVMALELLGPNLLQLLSFCGGRFSLKTVLMLALQMLSRIEALHAHGLVHRDVKPQNFLMGLCGKSANTVHLIDFGLSAPFLDPRKNHIPFRKDRTMVGTLRYASLSNHSGFEQSRRDDLESLGYVLVFLLTGDLPWTSLKGATPLGQEQRILDMKLSVAPEDLCRDGPPEFVAFLKYCRSLGFDQEPDYGFIRSLFLSRIQADQIKVDYIFDWTLIQLKDFEDRLVERASTSCPPPQ